MDTYFYGNEGTALINIDKVLNNSMRFKEREFEYEMKEMSTLFEQLAANLKYLFQHHTNVSVELGKHGVLVSNDYQAYLISSSNMRLDYIDTDSEFLNVMLVPVINTVQEGLTLDSGKANQLVNNFNSKRLTMDEQIKDYSDLLFDPSNRHPIDGLATELQTELQTELKTELNIGVPIELVPEVTVVTPIIQTEVITPSTNENINKDCYFDEDSLVKGGYNNIPIFSFKQYKMYYHELMFTKDTPDFLLESFKNLDDLFTYDSYLDYIKFIFDNALGVESIIQRHSDVSYVIAGDISVSINAEKQAISDSSQINYIKSGSISNNSRKVFSLLHKYISEESDLSYINWHKFSNNKSMGKYFAYDTVKHRIPKYDLLELQDTLVTFFKKDLADFLHDKFPNYRRTVLKTSLGIPVLLFSLRRQDQDHYLVAVTLDDYPYVSDSVDCYITVKDFDTSNFIEDFKRKLSE